MDIFEQIDRAHLIEVDGRLTQNFGYNADDPDEHWCLSVYNDGEEWYFMKDELQNAEKHGHGWKIPVTSIEYREDHHIVYFFKLVDIESYYDRVDV